MTAQVGGAAPSLRDERIRSSHFPSRVRIGRRSFAHSRRTATAHARAASIRDQGATATGRSAAREMDRTDPPASRGRKGRCLSASRSRGRSFTCNTCGTRTRLPPLPSCHHALPATAHGVRRVRAGSRAARKRIRHPGTRRCRYAAHSRPSPRSDSLAIGRRRCSRLASGQRSRLLRSTPVAPASIEAMATAQAHRRCL